MLIESIIRRAGGTTVSLDGQSYHFKPATDKEGEAHVAEVADEEHLARLLAIPEGFRIAAGSTKVAKAPVPDAPPPPAPAAPPAGTTTGTGMVLKRGDEEVDLEPMSKAKLIAFADANDLKLTAPQKKLGVDAVRALVFKLASEA